MSSKFKRTKSPKDLKAVTVWIQRKSDIQYGYLTRLIRLLRMSREQQVDWDEDVVWLVNRFIFACLLECIDNGVKDEAFEGLRRWRINFRFSARKTKKRNLQATPPK